MNKRAFVSLTLAFLIGLFLVQLFISSIASPTAVSAITITHPTAVSIQNDTPSQLQFTLHTATAVNTDGLVQIDGLDQRIQIAGEPALPYYSAWIALPPNGTVVIDVKMADLQMMGKTAVSPAINEQPDITAWAALNGEAIPALPAVGLMEETAVYQQNKLYPTAAYELSEPMHLRDLRLVELRLYPVRYNPIAKEMEQAGQMDVTISFVGASEDDVEKRPFNPSDSQAAAFADHILNYEQSKEWRHFPTVQTNDIQLPIEQETFKIALDQDGLYDISRDQLSSSINPRTIEMMYRGQAIAYDIVNDNGDTIFDAGEKIRFYGWAFDSESIGNSFAEAQFVNDNVYWLWANGTPTRIAYEANESGHPTTAIFPERLVFDPENVFTNSYTSYWPFENEQDAWHWEQVKQPAGVLTKSYTITLPYPADNSSNITYTAELISQETSSPTNITYTVRGQLNEYPVQSEIAWYELGSVNLTGTQPISSIQSLTNTMHLIFATDRIGAVVNVNAVTVEYDRELKATADQLFFRQPSSGAYVFNVAGFNQGIVGETAVWDISNPLAPIAITMAQSDISGSNPYTYTIGQSYGDDARFIATTNANMLTATVTTYTPPNLDPVNGADWIAITPAIFESRTNILATHRQNPVYGGHETTIVDIEDINNQYGYGLPLPEASRAYLTHALTTWPISPRYVTLVGNASHSPRGLPCPTCRHVWTTEDTTTYIPTGLPFIDRWQGLIPSDFTYSALIGNDLLPDIAVGRLTVNTTADLDAVIYKIIFYEANLNNGDTWINNVLFVADNADTAGDFPAANAATATHLPSEYNTIQLEYIVGDTNANTLRGEMDSYINNPDGGVSILNYRGHGAIYQWASPAILHKDSDFWANDNSPLIILSADCLDGYFAYPNYESLGRMFLIRPFGSAAHWSSSGLGLTSEHTVLHQAFYDGIFDHQYTSIGDAINYAKIIYAQSTYVPIGKSELYSFNLQGDPAMNVVPNHPGELQFKQANPTVLENAGSATITVMRMLGRDGAVSVQYATSNGTAIAGIDYTAASGTLNFADGEMSKTFTIPIHNNSVIENDKTVNLTLTNLTGATAGDPMQATLTIRDNDATVQFAQTNYTVSENAGTATIIASRIGNNDGIVTVEYATSDGTAIAGIDYITATGTITFAAGEMSTAFNVTILNETSIEDDETVNLTLSNPTSNATLGSPEQATLTIENDDTSMQFTSSTFNGLESEGEATISVSRIGNSTGTVSVAYTTEDGTAIAGTDYITASGTLTFTDGVLNQTFIVTILNDNDNTEGVETVNLLLSDPTGGGTIGNPDVATLTISDDGATVQFEQSAFTVSEDAGTATITLTRAGDTDGIINVDCATSDGTAIAGIDYEATLEQITFSSGEDLKTFTVNILRNDISNGNKSINLTLSNVTGGAIIGTPHPAVLTIINVNHVYLPIIVK